MQRNEKEDTVANRKIGLVLEGGAMRGMFSAGVMDVMLENNIEFDGMIGVSAGAAFGCNFKSKQIGRVIRYNSTYCRDKRYCGLRSLLFTGNLYGADFCYHELPEQIDLFDNETYINSPMEFYLVCTDIETGEAVYRKCDDFYYENLEWVRASAAMPIVSKIVEVGGYKLLDGGIADSIPLQYFEERGYEKNVVVLTQPRDYQKEKNKLLPIIKVVYRKYPKFVEAAARRHEMYNNTLEYIMEEERKGNVLVIAPDEKLPLKKLERNPERLRAVHEIGRKKALDKLEEIKRFLAE